MDIATAVKAITAIAPAEMQVRRIRQYGEHVLFMAVDRSTPGVISVDALDMVGGKVSVVFYASSTIEDVKAGRSVPTDCADIHCGSFGVALMKLNSLLR